MELPPSSLFLSADILPAACGPYVNLLILSSIAKADLRLHWALQSPGQVIASLSTEPLC